MAKHAYEKRYIVVSPITVKNADGTEQTLLPGDGLYLSDTSAAQLLRKTLIVPEPVAETGNLEGEQKWHKPQTH